MIAKLRDRLKPTPRKNHVFLLASDEWSPVNDWKAMRSSEQFKQGHVLAGDDAEWALSRLKLLYQFFSH